MLTLYELQQLLTNNSIDYTIISHSTPILSKDDAKDIFDIDKTAPVFILKAPTGLFAFIMCSKRNRINFKQLKEALGYKDLSLADSKEVFDSTGYKVGNIPLVGHNLPCLIDELLFDFDYIYGGTGDPYHTLKIPPLSVLKLNQGAKVISF